MADKHILFTNLQFATIGEVRTNVRAVLLEDVDIVGRQFKVRGFGPDPAWPVFDIFVKSIEYKLTDTQGNLFKIENDGLVPLATGALLQLDGGPEIRLVTNDRSRPLDVQVFNGADIQEVWNMLQRKAVEYMEDGLAMPLLSWHPVSSVKRAVEDLSWRGVLGQVMGRR